MGVLGGAAAPHSAAPVPGFTLLGGAAVDKVDASGQGFPFVLGSVTPRSTMRSNWVRLATPNRR